MRRMITRLSVLSALVLWSTASPVIRAQATTTTEHMTEPFDFEGADPCSGAPIVLTGDIETVLHITVDGHEGFHLNVHAQIHGTGQALTSDTSYVVNQSANFSVYADTCPAEETNEQDVEVVAEGKPDNFYLRSQFHATFDPQCRITAFFDRFYQTSCRG